MTASEDHTHNANKKSFKTANKMTFKSFSFPLFLVTFLSVAAMAVGSSAIEPYSNEEEHERELTSYYHINFPPHGCQDLCGKSCPTDGYCCNTQSNGHGFEVRLFDYQLINAHQNLYEYIYHFDDCRNSGSDLSHWTLYNADGCAVKPWTYSKCKQWNDHCWWRHGFFHNGVFDNDGGGGNAACGQDASDFGLDNDEAAKCDVTDGGSSGYMIFRVAGVIDPLDGAMVPLTKSGQHCTDLGSDHECRIAGPRCEEQTITDPPTALAPTACPIIELDFENFNAGDYVSADEGNCVDSIVAFANEDMGYTPVNGAHNSGGGAARIFDSGAYPTCDPDLLTPSPKFHGGPGGPTICHNCCGGDDVLRVPGNEHGAGHLHGCVWKDGVETPNPHTNDVELNNVLIIQEAANIDSCHGPDDTAWGGSITFTFCQPVFFHGGKILDIDEGSSSTLTFKYGDGRPDKVITIPNVGDNGVYSPDFDETNVVEFTISLSGSGSVAALFYSLCDPDDPTTIAPSPDLTPRPTTAPTVSNAPSGCPAFDLDFEGFEDGAYIQNELEGQCVRITAIASGEDKGFTPIDGVHDPDGGAARIYDSSDETNCDPDLLTPSPKFFDGPGGPDICGNGKCCGGDAVLRVPGSGGEGGCVLKDGMETPNPYMNDFALNNVLIIQEDNGANDCPDDTAAGGRLIFEFCEPVFLQAARILDVDGSETSNVTFTYSDENTKTIDIPNVGDNGVFPGQYDENDVVKFEVFFSGSGAVAELLYSICGDPDDPTTFSPTPAITRPPTKSPTGSPTTSPTSSPTGSPTS
ncbi:MAG: hypothetical protein SGILL_002544, partial [Bacillariaceae sp.]